MSRLLVLILLGPLFVFAEDIPPASYEMPRQVITDTPWSEEFSDRVWSAPFTKVTPQPLQLTSPNFENLFSTVTSVQSRTNGSPATSIRGSSQAGRVLYLLDNIPLNFIDGFGGSSLFVPTEMLSHVNIFEGPSSANYGGGAMGGALHFVPMKRSSPLLRVGLSDTDTSYWPGEDGKISTANFGAVVPLLHSEKSFLQASTFLEKDRGDFPFTTADGQRGRRRDNDQDLRRFTLWGQHDLGDLKLSHLLLYSGLNKTSPGSIYMPFVTDQKTDAGLAALSTDYKFSENTRWTSRVSYTLMHSDFWDPAPTESDSEKWWINQTFAWQFAPGFLSQTMIDFNKNYYTATFVSDIKYERSEPEFAQTFVVPVTDRLTFEPTIRYLQKYEHALFQVNLPYRLDSAKLWLMYSEGYRPPSLTDLFANTAFFIGNPNLQPEKSQQFESGFAWQEQNVNLSAALFYIGYKDVFQSTFDGTFFSKENIGRAHAFGLNTKMNVEFTNWLYHLGYSALRAREESTRIPLRFSPEHQFFSSITYRRDSWSFVAQQTLWSGFYDFDFINSVDTRMPAWQSTDLILHFKPAKAWATSLGLYNIFDKRRELTFGYPEPQRRVALAVEYSF